MMMSGDRSVRSLYRPSSLISFIMLSFHSSRIEPFLNAGCFQLDAFWSQTDMRGSGHVALRLSPASRSIDICNEDEGARHDPTRA